jgi:recombination associated protein RdgC
MGALKGSISVRRYLVLEKPPADARKRLHRGIKAHAFVPIDPKGDVERSAGWVSIQDGDDLELTPEKLFFVSAAPGGGEQLRVTLRIDVLKPPAGEVRRQVAARARVIENAEDRKLSRREKQTLKDEISRTLRLRSLPRTKLTDLVWNLDTGVLYLWSQTKGVNEQFLDLFVKSCALKLDVDGPARWARDAGPALNKLEPTPELWAGFPGVRPLDIALEVT